MRKADLETILNQIDEFREYHIKVRARFPFMDNKIFGFTSVESPWFYKKYNIHLHLNFSSPIDEVISEENNAIGHFINQNFIIRLFAILDFYGFVGGNAALVRDSPGYTDVFILKELRNKFAHSLGRYNPKKSKHKKLRALIISHYGLDVGEYNDFPLNVNEVMSPLVDGCKAYITYNYENLTPRRKRSILNLFGCVRGV